MDERSDWPKNPNPLGSIMSDVSSWVLGLRRLFDGLVEIAARAIVLGAAVLIAYTAWSLLFGALDPADSRIGKILQLLNDNWKVLLLLILPLFYQTIRNFLGQRELDTSFMAKRQAGEPPPTSQGAQPPPTLKQKDSQE